MHMNTISMMPVMAIPAVARAQRENLFGLDVDLTGDSSIMGLENR